MADKQPAKESPKEPAKESPKEPAKESAKEPGKESPERPGERSQMLTHAGRDAVRRYTAEFLGTFTLLFVGIGAAIFHSNTSGLYDEGFIALAVGLSIGMGIYAWGNISGGHFNPAVTLSFGVSGRMAWRDVIPYWVSQVLGACVGMAVVFTIAHGYVPPTGSSYCLTSTGAESTNIAQCTAMGANGYAGNGSSYVFSAGAVVLLEIVATFLFTSVILFSTDKKGWAEKGLHGIAIGFTLMILVLFGLGVDGLSVNPARSTGSAVLAAVAGVNWPIDQVWAFWLGPLVGAILGGVVWRFLHHPDA